jgi:DNA-binding transcriptional LysR family regulator
MELSDLALFAAVARCGGITRAAHELNTVQSNVTARIKLLEEELGTPLFHRHARGVALTAAGRQLLPYANRLAALADEAKRAVRADGTPRGPLALGSMETTAAVRLPPLIASFRAAWPDVGLTVSTGPTAELVARVLAFELDAALVAGPINHPDLVEEPVYSEEMALVTAPGRTVAAAVADGAVAFRVACAYRRRLEALLLEEGYAPVRWNEMGTLEGILGCVAAGLGVTLLPRAAVARLEAEGAVRCHPVPAQHRTVATVLIRRRDAAPSAGLVALQRHAAAYGAHQRRRAARRGLQRAA